MNATPKKATITVSGGSGSVAIGALGLMSSGMGVLAPVGSSYNITITDDDGFVVAQQNNCNGSTVLRDSFQIWRAVTVAISAASADADYTIKIWFAE